MIAREKQPLVARIPDSKGKNTMQPVEARRLHLRFACSVPRSQNESHKVLSDLIIQNAVEQVEQDIPIWEHKIYRPAPLLCDGDGPIAEYRNWFSQFYA